MNSPNNFMGDSTLEGVNSQVFHRNFVINGKTDELIGECEGYKEDYDFLNFAMWKTKVEFFLNEFGGSEYVKRFFDCFKGNGKEIQKDFDEVTLNCNNPEDNPGLLFQLIIDTHKQNLQRVVNLLSSLKDGYPLH